MKIKVSLLFFILLIVSQSLVAQKRKGIPPETPKLIISIVIEDMRYDYLYRYWDNFEEGGFRKLINEGTLCRNAEYNYLLTQTSPGVATIATGCEPVVHGVVSDKWFERITGKMVTSVTDDKVKTIGVAENRYPNSPVQMLTTTFSDELKLFNNQRSKVIGISLKPEAAILSTGHLANAAYWFDGVTGNWVTSSYYSDSLPDWVLAFNAKKFPDIYIEREWLPLLAEENYRFGSVMVKDKSVGFDAENKFMKKVSTIARKDDKYGILKATPYGISLTKDFATSAILDEHLGEDDFTDFLSIDFASTAEISMACGPNSIELEDLYIRLDRELAHFLEFIDNTIGKENVLVFLTSDHGTAYSPEYLSSLKIPSGEFNADRAIMLLGTYLNAIYDKGKWVSDYQNKQIYLNRTLIEDSGLKLKDVQDAVAQFMVQFTGIANAITASTLEETHFNHGIFASMQNSFNQKRSGDVMLNLEPGWIEKGKYLTTANSSNNYDVHVPLIWYGWKIKRSKIDRKIGIEDIAPTISTILEIPLPNGCTGDVIYELQ